MGVVRLMDMMNEREAIRNEALLLLNRLTRDSVDIQKIAAFEGAFERLFTIVRCASVPTLAGSLLSSLVYCCSGQCKQLCRPTCVQHVAHVGCNSPGKGLAMPPRMYLPAIRQVTLNQQHAGRRAAPTAASWSRTAWS